MNVLKNFIIRILVVGIPLIGLYYYSQIVFEANRRREHPTDAGLGIALLLFALLLLLSIGLIVDLVIRIKKKEYKIALTNIPFLIIFLIPILYINCQMGDYCEDCFCSWLIEKIKKI